jgi:outer membrane protein assembly factor BamD (BamD/ComL family)
LDSKILIPGDSIKSNWYLTYTENRYTFPEQGKYQFYVTGEISSNILEINVKEPTGVDEQAFKLFDKNGKYIMTRNESDHKDSMLKDFKQLIDLYPESKYVLYANTYLGRVSNKKVRPKAIRRVRREKIR